MVALGAYGLTRCTSSFINFALAQLFALQYFKSLFKVAGLDHLADSHKRHQVNLVVSCTSNTSFSEAMQPDSEMSTEYQIIVINPAYHSSWVRTEGDPKEIHLKSHILVYSKITSYRD